MLAIAKAAPGPCPGGHCSSPSVASYVNQVCKQNGWPVGKHVLVETASGYCYCTCSCLAAGSPVQATPTQMKTIETFTKDGPVMAADLNFQWTQLTVAEVAGTDQIGQPNTMFVRFEGGTLTVTADHLFLVNGKKLITADKLTLLDTLTGPQGNAVKIIELHTGDFFGSFHNVTTSSPNPPSSDPNGHLVNTNGVISGDYALQTYYMAGILAPEHLHAEIHSRPSFGSLEYQERYESADPSEDALQAGVMMSGESARDMPGRLLVRREVEGTANVQGLLGYVPLHRSGGLENLPHFKISDVDREQLGQYVCTLFGAFYPQIRFRVDWWVRNVNVLAIRGQGGRQGEVVINGGFLRVAMLDLAGVSLATAFCVANLNAGEGDQENVGYADYFGAAAVMRNVWWEMDFITKMKAAVEQMTEFLSYVPVGFGARSPYYPDGLCRIRTYDNALKVAGIPDCAVPPPAGGVSGGGEGGEGGGEGGAGGGAA